MPHRARHPGALPEVKPWAELCPASFTPSPTCPSLLSLPRRPAPQVPSRTNFTSLATPNQVGSGRTALVTLLHEGGHAAHFSCVLQRSPFFRQVPCG